MEQWDGTGWSADDTGLTEMPLAGVSCSGTSFCTAVGTLSTGPDQNQSYLLEDDGSGWSAERRPQSQQPARRHLVPGPRHLLGRGPASLAGPLTLATPLPSNGYLEVAADGGIFSFAPPGATPDFYGSMGGQALDAPIVGAGVRPRTTGATSRWRPTAGSSPSPHPG